MGEDDILLSCLSHMKILNSKKNMHLVVSPMSYECFLHKTLDSLKKKNGTCGIIVSYLWVYELCIL
jgi:hypothetical protein